MKPIHKQIADHFTWGSGCDDWPLVDTDSLSVKQERMPAATTENLHFHSQARQFFYILKGVATFIIDNEKHIVASHQGIQVDPLSRHKISNETREDLEFLVISTPSTKTDRIDLE